MSTVLVVDDSPEIRECLRAALEMHGYKVLEAAYLLGVEAMVTSTSDLKAVILDGHVPWAGRMLPIPSLWLAVKLREMRVRVVFHSGDSGLNARARGIGLTVVEKGAGMKALLEAVEGV